MNPRARAALEDARHALTTLHGLYAHDGNPEQSWRLDESRVLGRIDAALDSEAPDICGVVSASGPNGEPLACGYGPAHEGKHSWASLPSIFGLSAIGEERSG